MRVLYITHTSTKYTGANKSLLTTLSGLKQLGVEPIVVLPLRSDMTLKDELVKLDVKFQILKYYMPTYPAKKSFRDLMLFMPRTIRILYSNYLAERFLLQIAKKEKINLIHSNVGPLLFGHNVAKKIGIPHVWHLREFQDLDFNLDTMYSKRNFIKFLQKKNNYPIAISQSIYDHFELINPSKLIYNGIMKSAEAQFISEKNAYFLFVGYLRENKGIVVLLNAFSQFVKMGDSEHSLLIAGSSADKAFLDSLANLTRDLGISERVHFLGRRDDVYELMANAKAIVVPSFYEAFGRITAEAMFNGCFVIGNKTAGTREIIEKVGVGLMYELEDDLVSFLRLVAETKDRTLDQQRLIAKDRAVELFSEEQNAEKIFKHYKTILAEAVTQRTSSLSFNVN